MSKPPLFIDNIAFANKNDYISGELSLKDCPRLFEILKQPNGTTDNTDSISYMLQGKTDNTGQHSLHLMIKAKLTTICQRCLSEMSLNINLNFTYLLGDVNDMDLERTDVDSSDDYDLQQASKEMDIVALIEDEIIIAMPIAPMHEEGCKEMVTQIGEKPNPFAILKSLIKS